MSKKQRTNKADNPISPHNKIKREGGSVVQYESENKGGFKSDPNTTVLGTMNSIMSDQYNK